MKNNDRTPQTEEYLALDFSDPGRTNPALPLDRRQFLKLVGGGIVVLLTVPDSRAIQQEGGPAGRPQLPQDFNAFLRIGEDGRVTGFTGKIEMGQGVITSLAQMLADELAVSLDAVNMVMGDTDLCPWDMGTFGSMTTRNFGPALRAAAAEARAVLVELAAEYLQVAKERLKTKDGVVYEDGGRMKATYAELAKGKKILRHLKGAALETPSDFTIMGKPTLRKDSLEKVTGRAKYAGDVTEPGLLFAKILRPPAHDAKLVSADTAGARNVEGVQVIQDGDLIAVLHKYPDEAEKALTRIKSQYDRPAPLAASVANQPFPTACQPEISLVSEVSKLTFPEIAPFEPALRDIPQLAFVILNLKRCFARLNRTGRFGHTAAYWPAPVMRNDDPCMATWTARRVRPNNRFHEHVMPPLQRSYTWMVAQ